MHHTINLQTLVMVSTRRGLKYSGIMLLMGIKMLGLCFLPSLLLSKQASRFFSGPVMLIGSATGLAVKPLPMLLPSLGKVNSRVRACSRILLVVHRKVPIRQWIISPSSVPSRPAMKFLTIVSFPSSFLRSGHMLTGSNRTRTRSSSIHPNDKGTGYLINLKRWSLEKKACSVELKI
jgi:hypothetical protein